MWTHGENDTPVPEVSLLCSVWNTGELEAEPELELWVGENHLQQKMKEIGPNELRTWQYNFSLTEGDYPVTAILRYGQENLIRHLELHLHLPRSLDNMPPGTEMVFVTPKDPAILDLAKQLGENLDAYLQWMSSMEYVPDENAHGCKDYWQLPRETLELRRGDCEDFAVLLCSLLRAAGVPPERLWVVVGSKGEVDHVFLQLDNRWIEPYPPFGEPSGYRILFCFNDCSSSREG